MAILRHEPCIHGKDQKSCVFCVMQAKLDYLEDRLNDLEEAIYGDTAAAETADKAESSEAPEEGTDEGASEATTQAADEDGL